YGADTPEKIAKLSEEQKQSLSALSTLAAGLAGGVTGDSTANAVAGAQAGKNAVENNALGAGSDLGFWLGNTPGCDTACKTGIAKGVAEGNLVVSAGVAGVAGGALIIGATPEIVAAAKAALEGCKAAPAICLNNAGLQVAEGVTPGGVGAAGAIGVGKTAAEATAAKAEAVAASIAKNTNNAAHNSASYAGLKLDLKTTEAANDVVESLRNTGQLPQNYVNKTQAAANGWKPGKALNNTTPGGQLGGDIFENSTNILPSAQGRVWREADIGLNNTMSRSNQPGTRLLYSNDGLLYITTDHYGTATSIGKWK
ncbi:VENN motif pre-toxin domain-containing protein, partial [Serratia fonticola]